MGLSGAFGLVRLMLAHQVPRVIAHASANGAAASQRSLVPRVSAIFPAALPAACHSP
jgi:hypothetical protein